jgi:hypothetical protein
LANQSAVESVTAAHSRVPAVMPPAPIGTATEQSPSASETHVHSGVSVVSPSLSFQWVG